MNFEITGNGEAEISKAARTLFYPDIVCNVFTDVDPEVAHHPTVTLRFTSAAWAGYAPVQLLNWVAGSAHDETLHAYSDANPPATFLNLSGGPVFPRGIYLTKAVGPSQFVHAWGFFQEDQSPVEIPDGKAFQVPITIFVRTAFYAEVEME